MPLKSSLSWAALQEQFHDSKSKYFDRSNSLSKDNTTIVGPPPNGGYGWVIVAASFVVHLIVLGNIYNFGLFFRVYIDEFQGSHGTIAWIGSIGSGLMTGLGGFAGPWSDRFGNGKIVIVGGCFMSLGFFLASFSTEIWHLYLTQGFIAGIGYSLSFIAGVSVVGQWFTSRRGLAVGIAVAGSGAGQFVLAFTIGFLNTSVKWRSTLRILALIQLVCMTCAGLVIRRWLPCFVRPKSDSAFKYFKDRNFVYLYIGSWIAVTGLFMPYTHLAEYAEQKGVSNNEIVLIFATGGFFSALGRIVLGFAADKFGKLRMLVTCTVLGGTATLCWMACTTFPTLLIYFVCFNFFAGGLISLIPVVAAELFGIKELSSIIGILYTSSAAGNLLAAPIGGFLYDAFQDYYAAIAVAGGLMIISAIFLFLVDSKRYDGKINPITGEKSSKELLANDNNSNKEIEIVSTFPNNSQEDVESFIPPTEKETKDIDESSDNHNSNHIMEMNQNNYNEITNRENIN